MVCSQPPPPSTTGAVGRLDRSRLVRGAWVTFQHVSREGTSITLEDLLTRDPHGRRQGVLDYVDADQDYCLNFGQQWQAFGRLQLDSVSGAQESHERFHAETGWFPRDLKGKVLLDAGCGAGRFAEVALEAGARVVAVDLSGAAYACRRNLERFGDRLLVLRADLRALPLRKRAFDGVHSLGVLQHTPDPLGLVRALAEHVAPGGRLATWIYERRSPDLRWLQPRTYIRAALGPLGDDQKLRVSKALTGTWFPAGWTLSWFGRTGERLAHFLPYAARHHLGRGDLVRQWRYSVLDTFDWYGPRYDLPQRQADVEGAMREAGLTAVRRLPARGMAIVGDRPEATREPDRAGPERAGRA